jgi:AraC-like DNA-binding protein
MSGTLSTVVVRALLDALRSAGGDPRQLLDELGLRPEMLEPVEGRLPISVAFRIFERAPELARDELFCLKAASAIPLGALEVFDFATRSSATLGEAFERTVRYYALIDDRTELSIERHGSVATVLGRNRSEPFAPRSATELMFAMILARGEQLTGQPVPVLGVKFRADPPADPSGHERFFGAAVEFSQPHDELAFEASYLERPCATGDPALARFFDRHATSYLTRLSGPATFIGDVKRALAEGLSGSVPTLAATASRLAMSERTLQRRLRESQTSYSELVDQVRSGLAAEVLANQNVSIGEVGYLLGFSDTSAFYRAFRRWQGKTPADFRRRAGIV